VEAPASASLRVEALDVHLQLIHTRLALHVVQHTLLHGGCPCCAAAACALNVQ
jgi:hypothetical protein